MDNTHQAILDENNDVKEHTAPLTQEKVLGGFKNSEEQFVLVTTESVSATSRFHEKNEALKEEILKLKNAYTLMQERERVWKNKYLEEKNSVEKVHIKAEEPKKLECNTVEHGNHEENVKNFDMEDVFEVKISFLAETFNFAILDSGCTSTVCGKEWLAVYRQSLSDEEKKSMDKSRNPSNKAFRFGDGRLSQSEGTVKVPAMLIGAKVSIETDIVDQHIPMLLSRESMKRAKTQLNFDTEEVYMLGKKQTLVATSTGHYCIPLSRKFSAKERSGPPSTVLFTNSLCLEDESNAKKIAKKLHEQFAHPSSKRLIKLVKDGGVENKALNQQIEEVEKTCETCQKFKGKPLRPVVCFPRAVTFNENLAIDLKFFTAGYMLHTIDQFTRFSRTIIIKNKTAAIVLKGVLHSWIAIFGSPKSILADNGLEFNNEDFRDLCDQFGIQVYGTAAESPWSNGVNERHNALLGQMVEKLIDRGHTLEDAVCWATSSKNTLANIEGYSPSQLVFGINPNFPSVLRSELPALEKCTEGKYLYKILKAQNEAREEFIKSDCDERLKRAIKRKVRKHISSLEYEMGDKVYYLRKNVWKGPGVVIGKESKDVLVKHGGSYFRVHPCSLQRFQSDGYEVNKDSDQPQTLNEDVSTEHPRSNATSILERSRVGLRNDVNFDEVEREPVVEQVSNLPSLSASSQDVCRKTHQMERIGEDNVPDDAMGEQISSVEKPVEARGIYGDIDEVWKLTNKDKPQVKSLVCCKMIGDDEIRTYRVVSKGGKAKGANKHWYNVYDYNDTDTKLFSINWEQIEKWKSVPEEILISIDDQDYETTEAKLRELKSWIDFDVYHEVENTGQRYMTVQWVMTQKYEAEKRLVKARLVARGFQEDTSEIRKDSPTTTRESVRLLLNFAESSRWHIHSLDIKSAFLQGHLLKRPVYIKPPKEAGTDKLWKLNKCVYGLTDASRMWYLRVDKFLRNMGLEKMPLDEACYVYRRGKDLAGLLCLHVDDILWTGDEKFKTHVMSQIRAQFIVSRETHGEFVFLGLRIKQHSTDYSITIDQKHYIDSIEEPQIHIGDRKRDDSLTKDECKLLKSFVGQLSWASNRSRPDIAFETCEASVGIENSTVSDYIKMKKTLRKLKQSNVKLKFVPLENLESCSVVVYADASHANLKGSASQAGFVIFLVDKNRKANIVKWQSKKISRVVKSTLASETLAALEGIENAYYIKRLMEDIIGEKAKITVHAISDNKSLVEAAYSTNALADYRLRIDMACIRNMLSNGELDSLSWTQTKDQLADSLTKPGASCQNLTDVLQFNNLPS